MTVIPAANPRPLLDFFGNTYHHVDLLEEVDQITLTVVAEIETEIARTERVPAPRSLALAAARLLNADRRAPADPAVVGLSEAIPTDLDSVGTGPAVYDLLHSRFAFATGATDVGSTALDLVRLGRGVHQDFSHLMLAALRLRGIPAPHVSVYLAPHEATSRPTPHMRACSCWPGFDPASDAAQDGRYVVVAVGRDHSDIPPIRGTFHGVACEGWETNLRMCSVGQQ